MADQKIWFPDPIQDSECKILTLSEPTPSNWEVVQKINEHVEQWQDATSYPSHPSLASAKFVCRDAQSPNGPTAFLRIVKQIPSVKGDIGPIRPQEAARFTPSELKAYEAIRAREATQFTPPELEAYQALKERNSPNTPKLLAWEQGTQDSSGSVPGGFITWIIFEKVEGIALGDENGDSMYWEQPPETRAKIRKVFLEEYDKAADIGILPVDSRLENLIWNEERETIHFVGFEDPEFFKRKGRADNTTLAMYDLAKPCRDWYWRKDIDTSGWTF